MKNSRRFGALALASVAAMGMATVGLASPAAANERGPQPTSTWLRAVKTHTSTWVNIGWRTDRPACNVEVRVDGGRRVDIDYPGHRRYTTFSRGDTLRPGRADYTAIRINPDFNRSGVAVLRTSIRFDDCNGGRRSHTQVRSSFLTLPVLRTVTRHSSGQGQQGYGQNQDHRNNAQNQGQQSNAQNQGQQNQGQNPGQQNQGQNNGQNTGQQSNSQQSNSQQNNGQQNQGQNNAQNNQGQNQGQNNQGQNNTQNDQGQPYGQKPAGTRS